MVAGTSQEREGGDLVGHGRILQAMDKPVPAALKDKIKEENQKKEDNYADATRLEVDRDLDDDQHNWIAAGVTFFQVAVAISAIAILTKRRWFWYMSLVFLRIALGLLIWGQFFKPIFKGSEAKNEKSVAVAANVVSPVAVSSQHHQAFRA